MYNNKNMPPRWAILPILFCSSAVLAGGASGYGTANPLPAMPDASQQAQQLGKDADGFHEDTIETSLNTGYVGGNTRIGIGVDSDLKGKVEGSQVIQGSDTRTTIIQGYAGFNPKADQDKGEETLTGAGAKISHHWASGDPLNPSHINKVFGAYDQNTTKDKKATLGYGQERQNLFWSGHVSKGLSDSRAAAPRVVEKAYDYGVGGRVGTYVEGVQLRVQGGVDYEWGKDFAANEKRPTQTTLTGGVEKFFPDTPHSLGAEVEVYKKAGGALLGDDKAEARGGVSYRYDIASEAGVWQPEQRFRRIRTEIPGEPIKQPPKIERKLVKNTMELEADTFFKLDSAQLTPEAQQRLQAIMGQIRATGYEGNIRITGNTCDKGADAYNQKLSERRANAVRDFMVKNGFAAKDLVARGLGESQPKYPNTESERHKNRRVDLEYVSYQNKVKEEVVQQGGTSVTDPKVVWTKELIPEPPLWARQALRNVADHKQTVDTYTTSKGAVPPNTPLAVNDSATTSSGTPVTIEVLANDTDPNGDPLTINSFNQGTNGSVTQVGNELVYTPLAGFSGTDSFTYMVTDPTGNNATATVVVTVNAGGTSSANTPIAGNDSATTNSGTAVTIDVLANDSDPNGDPLTINSFNQGTNGSVTQVGNNLVYTPAAGFSGTDSFTYVVTDPAGNTVTATVNVTVTAEDLGAIEAYEDTYTVNFNSSNNVLAITENDKLPRGTVSISIVAQARNGTAQVVNNTLHYTPKTDYTGQDTLKYRLTDSRGYASEATVTLTIKPAVNNGLALKNDYLLIDLNDTRTRTLNVLANDTGEGMTIVKVSTPRYGTARISADGKSVLYTLRSGYCTDHTFTYTVRDKYGNEKTATVFVDVAPQNVKDPNNPAF